MKKIILSALLCLSVSFAFAQNIFVKNDQVANLTLGVGHGVPLELSYEYCVLDNLFGDENCSLGVGGFFGWSHYSNKYDGLRHHKNMIRFGVKSAIHYNFIANLDTYAGLMFGYRGVHEHWKGNTRDHIRASFDFLLGARYYFDKNWAAVAEFGAEQSYFRVGVAYKF